MDVLAKRFIHSPGVKSVDVDDTLVIADSNSGQYFGLNDVGADIWRFIGEGRTVGEIVELIARDYDAPIDVVTEDAKSILGALVESGLVQ